MMRMITSAGRMRFVRAVSLVGVMVAMVVQTIATLCSLRKAPAEVNTEI